MNKTWPFTTLRIIFPITLKQSSGATKNSEQYISKQLFLG